MDWWNDLETLRRIYRILVWSFLISSGLTFAVSIVVFVLEFSRKG
jgi:hypothetical protein